MAKSDAVWGIDIGQCGLKALRLRPHEEPGKVTVDAFDYIEYPKILSQPEADPAALVQAALTEFLSRNSVRGDRVAMSVPGQSGLARFIKLPPVESKKIPDIVKYEARQQIPFALDDVVWDYQKMVGGSEEEGFALETEVGLFAMKRDQVFRAIKPLKEAGIEVDFVQLTPLALYNYVAFDQMQDLPAPEDFDPESPPPSTVVLSLGTDSTDLVVTNGYRVWQRSVPIGGNHFTKALTKELKLTFASAEHLKRNAAKAEDPKVLFQAMRPVFNDMLTEVQRSIGYFTNLDRRAKIGRVIALGNAMKLPGLQRYLSQNLGVELVRIESFQQMVGPAVVDAPAFKQNVLTFAVAFGLGLQGLKRSKIHTNLVPPEIVKERLIREKKPWAVGAAAALLLGCTASVFGYWSVWRTVKPEDFPLSQAESKVEEAKGYVDEYESALSDLNRTADVRKTLVPDASNRDRWLKLYKIVDMALPHDEGERPEDITQRNEINITSIVPFHTGEGQSLTDWWTGVQHLAEKVAPPPVQGETADGAEPVPVEPEAPPGPEGPGWVIELHGHHYHNPVGAPDQGDVYVRNTLIKNMNSKELPIPLAERKEGGPTSVSLKELGIGHAVLVTEYPINEQFELEMPAALEGTIPKGAAVGGTGAARTVKVRRYDFVVQFAWQDVPTKEEELPPAEEGAEPAVEGEVATEDAAPAEEPVAGEEQPMDPAAADPAAADPAAAPPAEGAGPEGAVPDESPMEPADTPMPPADAPPAEAPPEEAPAGEGPASAPMAETPATPAAPGV